jgi:hypothetical protein
MNINQLVEAMRTRSISEPQDRHYPNIPTWEYEVVDNPKWNLIITSKWDDSQGAERFEDAIVNDAFDAIPNSELWDEKLSDGVRKLMIQTYDADPKSEAEAFIASATKLAKSMQSEFAQKNLEDDEDYRPEDFERDLADRKS